MKIFQKVLADEHEFDTRLGIPLYGAQRDRRLDVMSRMTGGRGFRVPPAEPRKDRDGRTRGQRKRLARAAAIARVSEARAPEHKHAAACGRRRYKEAA